MSSGLPSYRKPPVVETAISLQFAPIEGFTNAHLGVFWQSIRDAFPKLRDAEPIVSQIELFGDQVRRRPRLPSFRIVAGEAAARLQMSSADEQTMVQLQNGRIVFNWRRMNDAEYPRWHKVLPGFESALRSLRDTLAAHEMKDIVPNQWEVTYVNHFQKGRDWNNAGDWPALIPGLIGQVRLLSVGSLESIAGSTHLVLPEDRGRLHIELNHGFKSVESDSAEILVLQLTARGGLIDADPTATSKAMEIGHRAIVRTFHDLTGDEAHARWEYEQ